MKTAKNAGEIKVKLKKFYELFLHAAGPQKEQSAGWLAGWKRKQNITQPLTTRKEDKGPKREVVCWKMGVGARG